MPCATTPSAWSSWGYNTQRVRHSGLHHRGLFCWAIGGALAAIQFEIVTAVDSLSVVRSGSYLLFTFLGGATFFGPIIGAVLLVLASVLLLSELTKACCSTGLAFLFMVMFAPGGIASLVMLNLRLAALGKAARLGRCLPRTGRHGARGRARAAAMVEMTYHLQLNEALGPHIPLGATLNAKAIDSWVGAAFVLLTGAGLFELCRRRLACQWDAAMEGAAP